MPRTYSWTASVWQGDTDPFAELHTATVLRFLQETAQRASADAGYDNAYYDRTDRMWLVRRSTVQFRHPIRYAQTMEGRTWVADFRRVRSLREYEIRIGGRVVTHAFTDWVFADQSRGKPRRIPAEMEASFRPEGGHTAERDPFAVSPPPDDAHRFARRVEAHELDNLNHVNNASYARYVEEAVLDTLTALDWPLARQLGAGGRLRRLEHDFEYLTPAVYGDALELVVWPHTVSAEDIEVSTLVMRPPAPRPLLRARSRYGWTPTDAEGGALPDALHLAVGRTLR